MQDPDKESVDPSSSMMGVLRQILLRKGKWIDKTSSSCSAGSSRLAYCSSLRSEVTKER